MAHASPTLHLESPRDVARAAARLSRGDVVAHGFANLYALTTLPDATTVRATNVLKGRPAAQVGSVTTTPSRMTTLWDLTALPRDLPIDAVHALLDALYGLGPCGFRGPAAEQVPRHLTSASGGRATVQLIAPGYACPSNRFLAAALARSRSPFLHITSANRSRHVTGATDEPAHSRASALRAEFASEAGVEQGVVLLTHDEDAALARYPRHAPMSTTVLALDRTEAAPDGRVALVIERHGSLHVDDVRAAVEPLGFAVVLGAGARRRLTARTYDCPAEDSARVRATAGAI
ncbi:hypothetical protein [Humibacillus xanthopallidus]|uniref:hypothetical protein n=1 Tax=Humibacillus xanthopallidus TaxID=412689 RepID=UPI0038501C3F